MLKLMGIARFWSSLSRLQWARRRLTVGSLISGYLFKVLFDFLLFLSYAALVKLVCVMHGYLRYVRCDSRFCNLRFSGSNCRPWGLPVGFPGPADELDPSFMTGWSGSYNDMWEVRSSARA
jgi:hypothetical protein